jgi:APA family basic amino acid/polyamine antiporter
MCLMPLLGYVSVAFVCGGMIVALDPTTLKVAAIWMLLGILVYFLYSRHHSLVRKEAAGKK